MTTAKKFMACIAAVVLTMAMLVISASACSMVYVGSDLTEDGGTYFARSEDTSSANKVFYVNAAGKYKAGDVYTGCYGFTWTFTHDSYGYTAFSDDNLLGKCPDCGGTHAHTPYEEAGTNEKGVSVTSTVTLSANSAISKVDPKNYTTGIEEAEINTILLSESATAKEALELLMHIYETIGTQGGNGIIISDQTEAYYIENTTGTQYIAIKLNPSLCFVSPNISAMGLIDLDDPNVIASADLIAKAQEAGTFVGDAEANTINFKASYSKTTANARVVNGVNYLTGTDALTSETIQDSDYTISNVKDGEIVPFYTPFQPAHKMSAQDMVDFYKVDGIGNTGNLEYHVFQIYKDVPFELSTIEWVGMSHGAYGVMVPYYPILTTDTCACYQLGTAKATTVSEQPTEGDWYTAVSRGKTVYKVLPENWADSYFWAFEAVSKYVTCGLATDDETALVNTTYADLQQQIYDAFADQQAVMPDALAAGKDVASAYTTANSAAMADTAQKTAVALYNAIAKDAELALPAFQTADAPILFKDVPEDSWFAEAVTWAVQHKPQITNGKSNTAFAPDDSCTREQAVTFLWRAAGCPEPTATDCPFTDVDPQAYSYKAILWAVEQGITQGMTETTFDPEGACTRAQIVTFLFRTNKGAAASAESPFTDIEAGSWYADAVQWAVGAGVTKGMSDTVFAPGSTCTRAQIVTFLFRADAAA